MIASICPIHSTRRGVSRDRFGRQQIALICEDARLVGTITDGDIRRAILAGRSLEAPAESIMNRSPITARSGITHQAALALMRRHSIHQLPVVDGNRRLIEVLLIDDLLQGQTNENWVVLMAGGLGTRLRHLTQAFPKPMLKVGDKPILETILTSFI